MAETIEHYAMPKKIRVQGLREMEGEGRADGDEIVELVF